MPADTGCRTTSRIVTATFVPNLNLPGFLPQYFHWQKLTVRHKGNNTENLCDNG
jgi:hypothetical protein